MSESTVSGRFFVDEVEYSRPDENFPTAFYDRLVGARQELVEFASTRQRMSLQNYLAHYQLAHTWGSTKVLRLVLVGS